MKTCLVGCGGIAAVHGSVLTSGIDTEFVAAADIKRTELCGKFPYQALSVPRKHA